MEPKVLYVPSIRDESPDYDRLFQLQQIVDTISSDIIFDFIGCNFLTQNAVAFLGAIIRHIQIQGRSVSIRSLSGAVRENLRRNRFSVIMFRDEPYQFHSNAVPYIENREYNETQILQYLENEWLGRVPIQLNSVLKKEIESSVLELFINAFEHANSDVGVMACGQYFPKIKIISLTIVDFGVGIVSNVRTFLKNESMEAGMALKWAFQAGNTTSEMYLSRGLGLDVLKSFVSANDGKLEIFSNEGYTKISKDVEEYYSRSVSLQGTIATITLKADPNYYRAESFETSSVTF